MLNQINTSAFAEILIKGLSQGIIVIDQNYRILLWNPWMEKHSGINVSDILEKNIFEVFPDIQARETDRYIRECVENRRSFILSPFIHHYLIPLDIVRDDKQIRMFQDIKIFPLADQKGGSGSVILIRDLTESILYEKEIARLNRVLRGIRNVNQMITRARSEEQLFREACEILVQDIGCKFVWIGLIQNGTFNIQSPAFAGIDPELFSELKVTYDDSEYGRGVIGQAIRTGETRIISDIHRDSIFKPWWEFARKVGYFSTCALPLKVDGRVIGTLNIHENGKDVFQGEEVDLFEEVTSDIAFAVQTIRDRERRWQAEDMLRKHESRLRRVQKMEALGALAGGIAHDFNNLLYPMLGYSEMTIDEAPENERIRENMNQITTAANRASELVQQVLTFSRRSEKEMMPVQPELIVAEALKFLRTSLPATINIRERIIKNCGVVKADPTQMYQVVINLFTNAYQAIGETPGTLEVSLSGAEIGSEIPLPDMDPGKYIRLTVSDTGCGMDEAVMERIFEPYFTTKEIGRGTGLGLAIVHGIIMNHNGFIDVQSRPGKGSAFHIWLPVIEEASEPLKKISSDPVPGGNEHILLVDDEEMNTDMLTQILEKLGYKVTSSLSGKETLNIFRRSPGDFDLVITDQTMPEITGDELSREMLRIRPDIPIILCTGFSQKITEKEARTIGIRKFLFKPIRARVLSETIRDILEVRGNR